MTDNDNHDSDNISFFVDNDNDNNNEFNVSDITNKISNLLTTINDNNSDNDNDDSMMPQILNYQINFTVRQLLQICEYYGIAKEIKTNKFNKDETIQMLVVFENDQQNEDIVCKRRLLWFYADELKNDKYMKRYIIM
jgi:hypothetical protein